MTLIIFGIPGTPPVMPPPVTAPPPQAKLKGYVRAARGTPPGDPARVRTFVASAAWQPVYEVPEGAKRPATPPLWLIDVTRPRRGVKGDRDAIREIVERDGARLIVTDLAVFELAACTDRKNAACLTPRPDLPGHRANLDNERRQRELRDLRTKLK